MRRRRAAALGLAALGLCGCFAVNDPERHLPEPTGVTEFCVGFAGRACEAAVACCPGRVSPELLDPCTEIYQQLCNARLSPLVGDARVDFDEREAGRQLSIGRELVEACSLDFFAWLQPSLHGGFAAAVRGGVERGGDCGPLTGEDPRDPSSPRFFSCEEGLACTRSDEEGDDAWRCADPLPQGAPCLSNAPQCAVGLSCLSGTCQPERGAGQPCSSGRDCQSDSCQVGLMLGDAAPGRCKPREPLRFCELVEDCDDQHLAFEGRAGPVVAGGTCGAVRACVADDIRGDYEARGFECFRLMGECGAGSLCVFDADPRRVGVQGPGQLDEALARDLCALTRLDGTLVLQCAEDS